jgi:colicin import membrane protein
MPGTDDRLDLAPRVEPGALRAFALALLAHLLLAAALTWGIQWKSSDPAVMFEAELWSALPQEAAPALEAPPPPPPAPALPAPTVAPPPPAPDLKAEAAADAEIALEREKKRKADDKKKALLLAENAAKEKADDAAQAKLDAKKREAQKEQDAKKQAVAEAKLRKDAMDRMMGLAGATGGPAAKGSALESSGPSASYGGKVRARIKPNVVFTEEIAGNPVAEVEVRTTLDGTITSQRLVKSSGNKAWDEAVIKAIVRTETLPRDVDGRVPTPLIIEFRPRD